MEEELQENSEGLLALTLELQHAEEKYRSIVERNNDAIIQADKMAYLRSKSFSISFSDLTLVKDDRSIQNFI